VNQLSLTLFQGTFQGSNFCKSLGQEAVAIATVILASALYHHNKQAALKLLMQYIKNACEVVNGLVCDTESR